MYETYLIREYVNPLQGENTQKVGWNVSNIENVWYKKEKRCINSLLEAWEPSGDVVRVKRISLKKSKMNRIVITYDDTKYVQTLHELNYIGPSRWKEMHTWYGARNEESRYPKQCRVSSQML